ncbi:MAG TPA: glycosyltransferase family 4 protein, partial [Tepidisphaeraceae bacterium]|nr:glycosyltransferase family 4 protein [Tepidisphaeraceae bacterium]
MPWIVSQHGARQHYATPRAFQRQGTLDTFYTDTWAGRAKSLLTHFPGRAKAFAGRSSSELPPEKVVAFTLPTLCEIATRPLRVKDPSVEAAHLEWIREGQRFCRRVNEHLSHRTLSPKSHAFYGCKSVCLETLQRVREQGIFTLVDQADPSRVEEKLVEQERGKWPGWEAMTGKVPEAYYERCAAEWATASTVLVYSAWTKDAIVEQGVPAEKVMVVPLAFETAVTEAPPPKPSDRPLTVLWLGTVMLRKGIPYLIEAARKVQDRNIRFVVAGQILISEKAVASAPKNMQFIGRVLRDQAEAVYRSADVFVLPTISDSFALTQVEAMANGLPVIATKRCGEVVTDGVDGRIVPVADAESLAAAIAALDDDRALLAEMSTNARKKARTFSIDSYGDQVRNEVLMR